MASPLVVSVLAGVWQFKAKKSFASERKSRYFALDTIEPILLYVPIIKDKR